MKKNPDDDRFGCARNRNYASFLSLLCLLLITFGCASPAYRAHPDFMARARGLQKPALMLAEEGLYKPAICAALYDRDDEILGKVLEVYNRKTETKLASVEELKRIFGVSGVPEGITKVKVC